MSLVRWGSFCTFASFPWLKWCHDGVETCPGSSVYVYESGDGVYTCCGCSLREIDGDGEYDYDALAVHLRRHHDCGDHVPLVLFDETTRAREDAFLASMTNEQWQGWVQDSLHVGLALYEARQQAWGEALKTLVK